MTRTITQRDAARTRKQRQRDRQRERNRLAAEALAAQQERLAEDLAPHVLRTPVMAGDVMLLGPRVVIVNGRPMRSLPHVGGDPTANLTRNSPLFTERHQQSARQLQQDWSDVGVGCGVGAMDYLRSGGGSGDGVGGHKAMLAQIAARQRLEGALTFLGAFSPGVCRVVLDCIPVNVWAGEIGWEVGVAIAWLAKALDRLGLFYFPVAEVAHVRIRTLGPRRADYTTEMEDVA